MTKEDLKSFSLKVYRACSRQTCYEKVASAWKYDNRFYGHCAVVALLLNERFGGKIKRGYIESEGVSHYFNEIDGEEVDLTIAQYPYNVSLADIKYVSREELLKNEDTKRRYEMLRAKIRKE